MNIQYRKLGKENVSQYREIRLHSLKQHPEAYGSTFEEESSKEKLFIEKCIEENNANTFVAGAFDRDKLIGICTVNRYGLTKIAHRAELIQMYVDINYRNKQTGTGLLQLAIEETRKMPGVEQLELGVAVHNMPAIRAYKKAGFEETGIIKNALKINGDYIDEYLMVLFL